MTPEEIANLKLQLAEAKSVYHQLRLGKSVVSVTDQNGERVTFVAADALGLKSYIVELERQLPGGGMTVTRPIGFLFR